MLNILRKLVKPKITYEEYKTISYDSLKLYWWKEDHNFGDAINKFIAESISHREVEWVPNNFNRLHYMAVGSILDKAGKYTNVWGSGFIKSSSNCADKPHEIFAVRGPLTRSRLIKQGIQCPKIFGDPALLIPKFYFPSINKKYKIGIIPHFVDKNNPWLDTIDDSNVKIIDIQQENLMNFIDEMLSCEIIISSSLHGLILADAYDIPSLWVKFSDKIIGNDFKFHDYYSSINRFNLHPFFIAEHTKLDNILQNLDLSLIIDIDLDLFYSVCPFKSEFTK